MKTSVVVAALLLMGTIPVAYAFPYDPYRHSFLLEMESWRDPGGEGADLTLHINPVGDRLLLLGYGAPGEVRITDLDTGNPTVLETPGPGFNITGCHWSMSGDQVVVWGDEGGEPRILVYDAGTASLNGSVAWLDLVDLGEVNDVIYLADDVMVAVAGRDTLGTSRLVLIETNAPSIRWNHEWEGNRSIVAMENNGREVMVLDSGENLTFLGGHDWNQFINHSEAFVGGPSAWSLPNGMPGIFGDQGGRVVMCTFPTDTPLRNVSVGEGPVLGVAWTPIRYSNFVVAMGRPGGGTRLSAWQSWSYPPLQEDAREMCSLAIEGYATMIVPYPGSNQTMYVATEDGTLRQVRYDVSPLVSAIPYWAEDQVDGRGIEPFHLWYPGGDSDRHSFYFNNRGSLIALRGFGDAKDLCVVDRSFDTVAELSVPWTTENFGGLEWSHGDRWLVTWGYLGTPEDPELVIKVYNSPEFELCTTFPVKELTDRVSGIHSMEFLPGDTVLATTCSDRQYGLQLLFFNVLTGKVVGQMDVPTEGTGYELRSEGQELVMHIEGEGIWTIGMDTREYEREGVDIGLFGLTWDINISSGWIFVGPYYNVSVWSGTPREQDFTWEVRPNKPMGMAWTNGNEGDFVLGAIRCIQGSSIQLWRRDSSPEGTWRDLDGYTMVSELNTSRIIHQLEADPAYEGMVVASFTDGSIGLYHLNVTPYPPPPEELGNLSTEPIYPLDDGSGGDGSDLPWGSGNDWVFPIILVATITVLVTVLIVLRYRERRSRS